MTVASVLSRYFRNDWDWFRPGADLVGVEDLKRAALEVLLHNLKGPYQGLPRTAGWGYPEPYTRDWMIAALGILVTENEELMAALRGLFNTLAKHQPHGHILAGA
jgi:glycogen debranching enzyme